MKIRCPACQTILSVPDGAAGKVVKCRCGKQLRAPGGSSTPPRRPPASSARTAAPRPAPQRSAGGGFDPDIFEELTDQDLKPVSAVPRPGTAAAVPPPGSTGGKLLQQYAPTGNQGFGGVGGRQIAGVGARISGALIDGLFVTVGIVIAVVIMIAAESVIQGRGPAAWGVMAVAGVVACTPAILNIVLISSSGQTVGKKLVGTRMIVEATGEPARFLHGVVLRQFVFGLVAGLPFVGVFISIADICFLFTERAQTLHDRMAGTLVVEA